MSLLLVTYWLYYVPLVLVQNVSEATRDAEADVLQGQVSKVKAIIYVNQSFIYLNTEIMLNGHRTYNDDKWGKRDFLISQTVLVSCYRR